MTESSSVHASSSELTDPGQLIVNASRFSGAAVRRRVRERSPIVYRTLSDLLERGPQRLGELAAREHITQPTMTGVVQRMETEGLVERHQHPEDGRVSLIGITAAGRGVLHGFRELSEENLRPFLEAMTAHQRAVLAEASELMEQMAAGLEAGQSLPSGRAPRA